MSIQFSLTHGGHRGGGGSSAVPMTAGVGKVGFAG